MRTRSACLAVVRRAVLWCACVGGLTTTAWAQWWTTYNPDLIVGEWSKDSASHPGEDIWTLKLEGTARDVITGINISISMTNSSSPFLVENASGNPVDANPATDGYTHFLLAPGSGNSPNFISLGDGVSGSRLYGCLAATGEYKWTANASVPVSGNGSLSGGFFPAPLSPGHPLPILEIAVPRASDTLTTGNAATGWCPGGLTVSCAVSEPGVSSSATVDYLNPSSPEPIERGIDFFSKIPAGDVNADGRVDINDLTIVLANYGEFDLLGRAGAGGMVRGRPRRLRKSRYQRPDDRVVELRRDR